MEAVSRAALDPDMYKYSLNETRELLDAVQDWYKRRYDVTLADDEIMAVCGSQEGIAHVGFAFAGSERPDPCTGPGLPDLLVRPDDDRRNGRSVPAVR